MLEAILSKYLLKEYFGKTCVYYFRISLLEIKHSNWRDKKQLPLYRTGSRYKNKKYQLD